MNHTQRPDGGAASRNARRRRLPLIVGAFVLAVTGGLLLLIGVTRQEPAPPRRADTSAERADRSAERADSGRSATPSGQARANKTRRHPALKPSDPTQVKIPSIKVSSSLERLALDSHRAMETPADPAKAGWYSPGPTPGAKGPAVIVGHVTWNGTPSVFFKLARLEAGDAIAVKRADGTTAKFTVDRVAQYAKDHFPTVEVYRNLDHAGLRLITCGGNYSKEDRHYADNVVVYATLTGFHR